jgi:hypothetical protein
MTVAEHHTTNETSAPNEGGIKNPKVVEAVFNKKPILLPKGRISGLEIKHEAISQGLAIQPAYVLFLIKNRNHRTVIGDTDTVEIRKDLEFAAVADDDNS